MASDTKPAPLTAPDKLSASDIFLRNEHLEETRVAAAKGARALRDLPLEDSSSAASSNNKNGPIRRTIAVDNLTSPHAAATGALLGLWKVNHFKTKGVKGAFGKEYDLQGGREIKVVPLSAAAASSTGGEIRDEQDELVSSTTTVPLSWRTGEVYATAQNWARELMETPANLMTPTIFCKTVIDKLSSLKNVSAIAHDEIGRASCRERVCLYV